MSNLAAGNLKNSISTFKKSSRILKQGMERSILIVSPYNFVR